MSILDIRDHLEIIKTGKLPDWASSLGDKDFIMSLLAEEKDEQFHATLDKLLNQTTTRVIIGPIDPPRHAIDTCNALVRKLAALRDEHRSLQTSLNTHDDTLADLKDELAFKSRASLAAQLSKRTAAADGEITALTTIATRTEVIRRRLDRQLATGFDEGRLSVLARVEGDLAAAPQSHSGDPGEPREISVIASEAADGSISWSTDSGLTAQNDVAQRTRILTTAMARLRLIKERIGLRLSLEDAEIRKAGLAVEQTRAGLDKAEIALGQEVLAQEIVVLKRAIERLEARSATFLSDFLTRIRITLRRYVETARLLETTSARLAASCDAHDIGKIIPFDAKLLIDPGDDRDDDAAILDYADQVEALERSWKDRIASAAGGLFRVGDFVLRPDTAEPDRLIAVQPWKPPLSYCFVEGVLIGAQEEEEIGFACELVGKSVTVNGLHVTTDEHETRTFHQIPVTAGVAGGPDRENTIVRGGFFANLVSGRNFRLEAEAKGRDHLTVTLFVEAFGVP